MLSSKSLMDSGLFPHITTKNVRVSVNFGSKVRMKGTLVTKCNGKPLLSEL